MQLMILGLLTIVLVYILLSHPVSGLGRLLAPDVMIMVMVTAIFGIRPVFSDRFSRSAWYGIYVPTEADEWKALQVGVVAAIFFAIGVAMARPKIAQTRLTASQNTIANIPLAKLARFSVITTACSVCVYIALLTVAGGPGILRQLSNGRSAEVDLAGVPEIVMILPLVGSLAAALLVVSTGAFRLPRVALIAATGTTVTSVILVSQLGNRRFIIPALLIPIIAKLIIRPTRLKVIHIALGVVAFLFLAILPMVRAAGARRAGEGLLQASFRYAQEEGISGILRPVFASFDTEMFDYIAIASRSLQPTNLGYGRGTLFEFVTRPLPGSLTETAFSDQMLGRLFGGGCGQPFCPVASLPGVLFFDGGLILVAVGLLMAGFYSRRLAYLWSMGAILSTRKMIVVATIAAYALVITRSNSVHAIWWCIYTLILASALHWAAQLMSRRHRLDRFPNRVPSQELGQGIGDVELVRAVDLGRRTTNLLQPRINRA